MIKVDLSPETITYSGDRFMKNKRRNHSAQFKAKAAFAAAINRNEALKYISHLHFQSLLTPSKKMEESPSRSI
jgi:hypothetical protein